MRFEQHLETAMQLNATDAKFFLEILSAKGVRKAAERLDVSSSILSRRLSALERSLGVRLFERKAQGMTLTAAGEIYAAYVRDALLEESRLRSDLSELQGLKKGVVRIYSPEGYAVELVSRTVVRFRDEHPGISFEVFTGSSERILVAVQEGVADIGLAFTPGQVAGVESAMSIGAPLLAVMAPGHPLAREKRLTLAQVVSCPLALPEERFGIRRLVDTMCTLERVAVSPAVTTNSVAAMKTFARQNGGLTLLPEMAVEQDILAGTLMGVPLKNRTFSRTTIELCVLARRRLPLAVHSFLRALKEQRMAERRSVGSPRVAAPQLAARALHVRAARA
jgi:DNA-binding transcriptional LysR family regulator